MAARFAALNESSTKQTFHLAAIVLLLTVFTFQLTHIAHLYSANWDEAHHLYDGYKILTQRDYRANAEVPPLVKLSAALPLLALHPKMPPHLGDSQSQSAFMEGRAFVFGNGGDRLLFPARVVCMIFTLATALLIYAGGRNIFGATAGLFALLLFVFDPNALAHGTLVSTDMASACFLFATVYAFYRYTLAPRLPWLLTTGLLAGLAMVAKFTGLFVAPILLLLAVADGLQSRHPAILARRITSCLGIFACAWLVIWAFYGFRDAPAPGGLQLSPALRPYIASVPGKGGSAALSFFARLHLLPQAYLWGLANTKYTEWEYTSYFLGRVYRHGPAQYFPLAFVIKSTLPLLLLLLLTPFAFLSASARYGRQLLFLLLPVLVYFAVIASSHFDIGARHMMPIYPFLYVLAGATATMLARRGPAWAVAVVALGAWQIITTIRVAPNYMAYGNEAWGGPLQVRRYLSDANVDWGQQLKTVKQYLDRNGITNCWFAYFPDGAVEPSDYGIHCQRLPTPSGLWWFRLPMQVPPEITGTVLISESDLDGVESGEGVLNPYDAFRTRTPQAILQDGVYVYNGTFPVPLASAWVLISESGELAKAGRNEEAFQLAEEAVRLAPESPRAQLNMGYKFAALKQWPEAAMHYRFAQIFLQQQRPDLQGEELGPAIEKGLRQAQAQQAK